MAHEIAANSIDEYTPISESSSLVSLKAAYRAVDSLYGSGYLDIPNATDLNRIR